jgi:hypothetical protein
MNTLAIKVKLMVDAVQARDHYKIAPNNQRISPFSFFFSSRPGDYQTSPPSLTPSIWIILTPLQSYMRCSLDRSCCNGAPGGSITSHVSDVPNIAQPNNASHPHHRAAHPLTIPLLHHPSSLPPYNDAASHLQSHHPRSRYPIHPCIRRISLQTMCSIRYFWKPLCVRREFGCQLGCKWELVL